MEKYKVIVWGLGHVARSAVRMIAEKESVELVAAVDVDPNKIGKDAGEVFGFEKTGVIVTDKLEEVLAMEADVVLAFIPTERDEKGRFTPSAEKICQALRAKKNVITTVPLFYSNATDPEIYEMINTTAKENGVTFNASGLLSTYCSYIPMIVAGMMGRVDKITVETGEDDQYTYSPWIGVFGYGKDPKDFSVEKLQFAINTYYSCVVYEMADYLGFECDDFTIDHEMFTTPIDLTTDNPNLDVKKDTICGHKFIMTGWVKGDAKVEFTYTHKVCDDQVVEPKIQDLVHCEGLPGDIDCEIKGMMPPFEAYVTSAAPAVNSIPCVVEAEAGYKQALELKAIAPIK